MKAITKNRKGFITIDFLFALTLVLSFTAILFSICITLTVTEITQYMTFAAARNFNAAHIDQSHQHQMALAKYEELSELPIFKTFFDKGGWFSIDKIPLTGDIQNNYKREYHNPVHPNVNLFWGVGTHFQAELLNMSLPFYGNTSEEEGGEGFKTFIASYLGREVTAQECIDFTRNRWKAIRELPVSEGASYSTGTEDGHYVVITDNGC